MDFISPRSATCQEAMQQTKKVMSRVYGRLRSQPFLETLQARPLAHHVVMTCIFASLQDGRKLWRAGAPGASETLFVFVCVWAPDAKLEALRGPCRQTSLRRPTMQRLRLSAARPQARWFQVRSAWEEIRAQPFRRYLQRLAACGPWHRCSAHIASLGR